MILSASLTVLQQMVSVFEQEMTYLDMKFNTAKSMVLRIGKSRNKRVVIFYFVVLIILQFVSTVNYLGVYVESANVFMLNLPVHESQSEYFRSTNGIFYTYRGNMCETVMMHLFSSY